MNSLSRLIDLYRIENSNFGYYNAKSKSCHLKRSDVWFEYILRVTVISLAAFGLFCAINMSLLLGIFTILLGSSFSYLLFLIKLLVTGDFSDGYSMSKAHFQEEIDYKISAEICKSKSKIYMMALGALNKVYSDERPLESDKKLNHYNGDREINSMASYFKKFYKQCSSEKLKKECVFTNNRLKMLYGELNIAVCLKVMYKKLKVKLNDSESGSISFRPKNPDNNETFRRLIFSLAEKYKIGINRLDKHFPLDSLDAKLSVNYKIWEIAVLEIRKVLVDHELADRGDESSSKSVGCRTISSGNNKGLSTTVELGRTTTAELTTEPMATEKLIYTGTSHHYSKTLGKYYY